MTELTAKQRAFVDHYLLCFDPKEAGLKAGYSPKAIHTIYTTMKVPAVAAAIKAGMQESRKKFAINKEEVLRHWWEIANVDVNELIEYRRVNCRYCWGIDHQYQWTHAEFLREQARNKNLKEALGGFGFKPSRKPNPECPECDGEGHGDVYIKDSRELTGAAKRLYGGVKIGKDTIQLLLEDRSRAMENVAKHIGMLPDRVELTGKDGGPIKSEIALTPEDAYRKLLDAGS